MLSVRPCAGYQADPKELHLLAIKHIMRYLVGTPYLGIWYPKKTTCSLIGYLDANLASSRTDMKSILGGCQFLSHSLVSWQCKKQNSVALSIVEAKYIVARSCYA